MGISLTGLTPSSTYPSLIKFGDNLGVTATLKTLSDGDGNDLPIQVKNNQVNIVGTITQNGLPITTPPSGVAGAIQFSNGSAFASDAANLFWDDTNNRLGVGTNAPINNLTVIDSTSGSTSGDKGITVGNSNTANALRFGSYFNIGVISGPSGPLMLQTPASNKGVSISTGYLIPTAMAHIQGSGSTSATTSLLVQNSSATEAFKIQDNGTSTFTGNLLLSGGSGTYSLDLLPTTGFRILNDSGSVRGINNSLLLGGSNDIQILNSTSIGNAGAPNASSILDLTSTTKGFLPPRMTTTQKNAIASPAAGLVVYDNTTNKLQCYNGSTWNDLF
jgi:hypothetical protein